MASSSDGTPHYPDCDETEHGRRRVGEKERATEKGLVKEKRRQRRQSKRERIKKIENDYSRERARNTELGIKREKER